MKPLEPDTLIQGRYRIRELIGKGGMGQVYLAIDQRLGHSVALKRTTVGDDPSLAVAFENEARTLAQLRHPFLPKVSDHFVEGDEQFLVMEYIAGDDLSRRLKSLNKPFPLNWVLFWADELLEALTYLHTHDPPIIHRDIKPQNLKITNDNHIVLLDFGLSKHSVSQTKVTTSGSVVGYTPHYAPMEQIRGTGTSALSDIYALSATLYHLLSNRVPPDALTRADALLAGKPDPLRPLTELNGEMNEVISDAILKGMELNQDNRFPSSREMQKRLRKAYNQLQKSMAADTVAFNVNDIASDGDGDADEKTEVMTGGVPGVPVGVENRPDSAPPRDVDKTEVIGSDRISEVADGPPPAASEKTEVMSGLPPTDGVEPESDVPSAPPEVTSFETSDDASVPGDYETSEDFETGFPEPEPAGEEGPPLDATVAAGGLDSGLTGGDSPQAPPPFETEVNFEGASESVPEPEELPENDEFAAEDVEVEEESLPGSVVTAVAAKPEGSSTAKYIGILLGLLAVLILVFGIAAGIIWYMIRSGGGAGGESTPVPTATESPLGQSSPTETPTSETPAVSPEETVETTPSPEETQSPGSGSTTGPRQNKPVPNTTRPKPVTPKPVTPKPQKEKPKAKPLPTILQ